MITWDTIENFKAPEFACRCDECNSTGYEMNMNFILALDYLRQQLGSPMIITSGYRCPEYNDRIASTGRDGPHTTGRAADIGISGERAFHLVQQCFNLDIWMTGIGINQKGPYEKRFIHLDDLDGTDHPRPRIWTY